MIPADLHLSAELQNLIGSGIWQRDMFGCSEMQVYAIERADQSVLYLKVGEQALRAELEREGAILHWLQGKLPVPQVYAMSDDGERAYLLMTGIPGVMAFEGIIQFDIPRVIKQCAEGLRRVHALSIAECPFDQRLAQKITLAAYRVEHGLVDEQDFDLPRLGMTAAQVLALVRQTPPATEDLVFTHGDYCLPNILLDGETLVLQGFVDWGRGGIADRYQDLGIAARSITSNLGEAWVAPFFAAYGIPEPDQEKIAFYQVLDELF